jgi:hypothetical protein
MRRALAISALSIGSVAGPLAGSGAAHADARWAVAVADWNCPSQTVGVRPSTNEELWGNFGVWSYVQVYDYDDGGWITEQSWSIADGITVHEFYSVTNPYGYAYVHYAWVQNGAWVYAEQWVPITNDLDNAFCGLGSF